MTREWDDVLNVNLRGTFLTDQIAFPYLKERGGRIVNFGSDSGLIPHPGGAHYAASKGGVIAWTRSIASEWGKYRITANTVLPAMKTPMYEEHRQRFTPEEIARFDESKHCGATSARRTIWAIRPSIWLRFSSSWSAMLHISSQDNSSRSRVASVTLGSASREAGETPVVGDELSARAQR